MKPIRQAKLKLLNAVLFLLLAGLTGCSERERTKLVEAVTPRPNDTKVVEAFETALRDGESIANTVEEHGVRSAELSISLLKDRLFKIEDLPGYKSEKHSEILDELLGAVASWNGVIKIDELVRKQQPDSSDFLFINTEFENAYGKERFRQIADAFHEKKESPYLSGEFRAATLKWAKHRIEMASNMLKRSQTTVSQGK